MKLESLSILDVWSGLGGAPLRHGRGAAFWRRGSGLNIAIDTKRNLWFDHVANVGGGPLKLVEMVLRCDRASALKWLETHCGLDPLTPRSPAEQRLHETARHRAKIEGPRLENFVWGLSIILKRQIEIIDFLTTHGIDTPTALESASRYAYVLDLATPRDIIIAVREITLRNQPAFDAIERIGRRDREDADRVTREIVELFAAAAEGARA